MQNCKRVQNMQNIKSEKTCDLTRFRFSNMGCICFSVACMIFAQCVAVQIAMALVFNLKNKKYKEVCVCVCLRKSVFCFRIWIVYNRCNIYDRCQRLCYQMCDSSPFHLYDKKQIAFIRTCVC